MTENARKHGLGRGLSALLGDSPAKDGADRRGAYSGLRMVATADVRPNPGQPR